MNNSIFGLEMSYVVVGIGIAAFILLIWNIVLTVKLNGLSGRHSSIMGESTADSVEAAIVENVERAVEAAEKVKVMEKKLEALNVQLESCIQRVDIIRYKAFSDSGNDLSYSLALLNNKNDGLLLTGIYGRSESYTYAKPINAGESTYALSSEEIQVLNKVKK